MEGESSDGGMSPGAPKAVWYTAEFYNGNERSSKLREVTLKLLNILIPMIESSSSDETSFSDTALEILSLENQIQEMGVSQNMHADQGLTEENFAKDPVLASEYLAGQCLNTVAHSFPDKEAIEYYMAEHNEISGRETGIYDLNSTPANVRKYFVMRDLLHGLKFWFSG